MTACCKFWFTYFINIKKKMAESSKKAADIVVVGSCMVDFTSYSQRPPKVGETIKGKKFITSFGGKGANQCISATRLGASTALVARVGDDMWSKKYIENLKKEGVDTSFVRRTPNMDSGIAQITVFDQGESQIVIIPGANDMLSGKDVKDARSLISEASVLVLQLETSQEVAVQSLKLCKGISILNAAPATSEYRKELLTLPTIFCVNEVEAETFTSLSVPDVEQGKAAAKKLISMGCNSVIITLGEKGCVYSSKDGSTEYYKCPEVECVDSSGAGDAFIGSLAYMLAYHKNKPLKKCIEVAIFIASDSVTKPGTQNSYPDKNILSSIKDLD